MSVLAAKRKKKTLERLLNLAESILDDCRRALASAEGDVRDIEKALLANSSQRRLALGGTAGLTPQAIAECAVVLDARERRLKTSRTEAEGRRLAARERVETALREKKKLSRLNELRDEAVLAWERRRLEQETQDVARTLQLLRRREEDVHELTAELA